MIHKTTRSILSVLLAALLLVTSIPLTPAFADGGGQFPRNQRVLRGECWSQLPMASITSAPQSS